MSYLIQNDFRKIIQTDNLNQIIGSDTTLLTSAQAAAQSEAISYLIQKYDTTKEFTDTNSWVFATVYKGKNRIYLDATAYSATLTYALNSLALQSGSVYICTTAITVAEAFNITKWTLLGLQYSMFYITLPQTEFNFYTYYTKGTQVFWKDNTYTCQISSTSIGHADLLAVGSYINSPNINVFPDNILSGVQYWGTAVAYSVPSGTLPTNATKWTAADNRNAQMVNLCVDIALYILHSRIAPRNIPDLRIKRYDEAIKWLKMAGKGEITANLPLLQPISGGRIRYGGNVKQINFY